MRIQSSILFSVSALIAGLCCPIATSLVANDGQSAGDAETMEVKASGLTLNIPSTWKVEEPANAFRLMQIRALRAKGDKEDALLTVFQFGASDVKANVARWINQFEPDGRKVRITKGKAGESQYLVVELGGTYKKPIGPPRAGKTEPVPGSRVLNVMMVTPGAQRPYFFKFVGPDKTVAAATKALRASFGGDSEKEEEIKLGDELPE